MFVIVGDSKGEEYDEVKNPSFAPDHKTVVYQAWKGTKSFIVFGDKIEVNSDFSMTDSSG